MSILNTEPPINVQMLEGLTWCCENLWRINLSTTTTTPTNTATKPCPTGSNWLHQSDDATTPLISVFTKKQNQKPIHTFTHKVSTFTFEGFNLSASWASVRARLWFPRSKFTWALFAKRIELSESLKAFWLIALV